MVLAWHGRNANRIAEFTLGANGWQHRLRKVIHATGGVVEVHVFGVLDATVPVDRRLLSLDACVLLIGLAIVARTVP